MHTAAIALKDPYKSVCQNLPASNGAPADWRDFVNTG